MDLWVVQALAAGGGIFGIASLLLPMRRYFQREAIERFGWALFIGGALLLTSYKWSEVHLKGEEYEVRLQAARAEADAAVRVAEEAKIENANLLASLDEANVSLAALREQEAPVVQEANYELLGQTLFTNLTLGPDTDEDAVLQAIIESFDEAGIQPVRVESWESLLDRAQDTIEAVNPEGTYEMLPPTSGTQPQ